MITRARLKELFNRYERPLSAGALLFGFIIDSLTLRRVDLLIENIAILSYLALAALSIIILNIKERSILKHRLLSWLEPVAPFLMQIVFGASFSAFVVFYSRSASLSASWLFIGFLFAMLIGNEMFRPYYERLTFHTSVFFLAAFSYSIFAVPVVLRSIGTWQFLLSMVAALLLTGAFIGVLSLVARERVRASFNRLVVSIIGITAVVLGAYALNIIPPIPLSLKDSAIAHGISRSGNDYILVIEPRTLLDRVRLKEEFHYQAGEPVYVWTSVFAPTHLNTPIVHEWQKKIDGKWTTLSRITFPILGGSDRGYRGYSIKENIDAGEWRVSVETERGQVIGRVRFDVVPAQSFITRTIVR